MMMCAKLAWTGLSIRERLGDRSLAPICVIPSYAPSILGLDQSTAQLW